DSLTQSRAAKRSAIVENHFIQIVLTEVEKPSQLEHRKAFYAATSDIDFGIEVVLPHPAFQKGGCEFHNLVPPLRRRIDGGSRIQTVECNKAKALPVKQVSKELNEHYSGFHLNG